MFILLILYKKFKLANVCSVLCSLHLWVVWKTILYEIKVSAYKWDKGEVTPTYVRYLSAMHVVGSLIEQEYI